MRRTFWVLLLLSSFLSIFIISGCSIDHKLKLTDTKAEIVTDEGINGSIEITYGEKKGEKVIPTELHYTLTFENTGFTSVVSRGQYDIKIVPDQKLQDISEEIFDENIFNDSEGKDWGGHAQSLQEVKAGDKEEWEMTYIIGAKKENPEIPQLPSKSKLKKLKNNAHHATLVLMQDGKEVADYSLDSD